MKKERLEFIPSEDGNVLEIHPIHDEKKHKLMFLWLIAFTIGGLAIISQLFTNTDSDLKIMLIVFAFFWAYFGFKVFSAYRWRKYGKEKLIFGENKLYYGRLVNNRGVMYPYNKDLLGKLKKVEISEKNFFAAMGNSYWTIGNEKLAFSYAGKQIPFALDLDKSETNLIIKRTQAYFQ